MPVSALCQNFSDTNEMRVQVFKQTFSTAETFELKLIRARHDNCATLLSSFFFMNFMVLSKGDARFHN